MTHIILEFKRHYRYKPDFFHIPGTAKNMVDECSRLWDMSNSQLLSYFNFHYPQTRLWTMRHLRPEINSTLTCSLLRQRSRPELYLPAMQKRKKPATGGTHFAPKPMQTPTCRKWPTLSLFSKHSVCDGGMDPSHPAVN